MVKLSVGRYLQQHSREGLLIYQDGAHFLEQQGKAPYGLVSFLGSRGISNSPSLMLPTENSDNPFFPLRCKQLLHLYCVMKADASNVLYSGFSHVSFNFVSMKRN